VVKSPPVLTEQDIFGAMAMPDEYTGGWYVAVTLTEDARERFRIATRENIERRIAIVIDDMVESAPIVKSEIGGGHISITMGAGALEKQKADADSLARALSGR
jgi:preprotein translocase subunit SecD